MTGAIFEPSGVASPGTAPSNLSRSAHSAALCHVSLGWAGQRYTLRADVLNLFDSDDRDIE